MPAEELIRSCAESSEGGAWDEFVSRYHRAISLSIIRTSYQWGHAPQELVDDLVQETYLKLCGDRCRRLLDFAIRYPEAVPGYIKTIAVNVAHDYFKAHYSQKRGSGGVGQLVEDIDAKDIQDNFGGPRIIEREVLLKQINQCLETRSTGPDQERDCMIFWLHYRQGMSAKAIASLPAVGLTAKGVESAILRLTRMVRDHLVGVQRQPTAEITRGEKGIRPAESY